MYQETGADKTVSFVMAFYSMEPNGVQADAAGYHETVRGAIRRFTDATPRMMAMAVTKNSRFICKLPDTLIFINFWRRGGEHNNALNTTFLFIHYAHENFCYSPCYSLIFRLG
ncbi:MAG: hypothetical protein LBO64_01185, partial [Desulfovibrio sp.]|nr:hypothetical protein [Desulfovibrio sp.]